MRKTRFDIGTPLGGRYIVQQERRREEAFAQQPPRVAPAPIERGSSAELNLQRDTLNDMRGVGVEAAWAQVAAMRARGARLDNHLAATLLRTCWMNGHDKAAEVMAMLQEDGVDPNDSTYGTLIQSRLRFGQLVQAGQALGAAREAGQMFTATMYGTMIDMCNRGVNFESFAVTLLKDAVLSGVFAPQLGYSAAEDSLEFHSRTRDYEATLAGGPAGATGSFLRGGRMTESLARALLNFHAKAGNITAATAFRMPLASRSIQELTHTTALAMHGHALETNFTGPADIMLTAHPIAAGPATVLPGITAETAWEGLRHIARRDSRVRLDSLTGIAFVRVLADRRRWDLLDQVSLLVQETEENPGPDFSLAISEAYAHCNRTASSVAWLFRAHEQGVPIDAAVLEEVRRLCAPSR